MLLLVLALAASAADRAEEVRATEIAFAKAFADRDAKKFFSHLADDAQFLGRRNTLHGKQEVIAGWSQFFKPSVAPFRWEPERVVINAAGDLGFSSGPVFDETGVQIGTFTSTWVKTVRMARGKFFSTEALLVRRRSNQHSSRRLNESRNLLTWQGERNDGVFRSIIRPEKFAVES
jgi:ketosteroid isomerase-like protein